MTVPLVLEFKNHAVQVVEGRADPGFRAGVEDRPWVAMTLHELIKTRGAKTVGEIFSSRRRANFALTRTSLVRCFPHGTADLEIALKYFKIVNPISKYWAWYLRYVTLLWLSLVVMLPFDLAQFDTGSPGETFAALEDVGKSNLARAGLDREAAALLLARLYAR